MDFIKLKLRRLRRRNRIPHGLLVSVSAMLAAIVLTATLGATLLALPASAKTDFRMPRTEDGIVTDGDGVIDSGAVSDMLPNGTDMMPDGDGSAEGESIIPDVSSGDTVESGEVSTTDAPTDSATTDRETAGMGDDVAENNTLAWVIGLVALAAVVIAIVLIIRWATNSRKTH